MGGVGGLGRQDPMAFFSNQGRQPIQQSYGGLGGMGGIGGNGGFQPQPPPLQQQSSFGGFNTAPGYSLSPQPVQPIQPQTQRLQQQQQPTRTNGNGNGTGQQQGKKDAFADLVDLMN